MITVVCFWWFDPNGARNNIYLYTAEHVLLLQRMVARHLSLPHEFVCVTDRPEVFKGTAVRAVKIDKATHLPGTRFVKLMLFRGDIADIIGKRILYLDLDCVVTGQLDPVVDRNEALVLWRNPNFGATRRARYNTSIMLLTAGARPELHDGFDPKRHPRELAQYVGGTDQAWVSHRCTADEAHWTDADGVYGAGRLADIAPGVGTRLPDNARIVFFPGAREPSMAATQDAHPWIRQHRF